MEGMLISYQLLVCKQKVEPAEEDELSPWFLAVEGIARAWKKSFHQQEA